MFSRLYSVALVGIEGLLCEVEVDVATGGFERSIIVGLPDVAVKESLERVKSAILNSGHPFPNRKSVINLAPADVRKEGASFDLPIALGLLFGLGTTSSDILDRYIVAGELALAGTVRPVKGALAMARLARSEGFEGLVLPVANAPEAAVVEDVNVIGISSLTEALAYLEGRLPLEPVTVDLDEIFKKSQRYNVDFADVRGQEHAKRALTIAAAGHHNVLMIGPPGSGKTMLARRLPTIIPPLSLDESIQTTLIYSAAGRLPAGQSLLATRPFRSPHHTCSPAALVGGGSVPQPGELSLAHHGVLFLDEFPEFPRQTLEAIRQPLEEGCISIARARGSLTFPARCMLVAAMNPCACGHFGDPRRRCRCSARQVEQYRSRISGPLLDRIDIHIEVPPVGYHHLARQGSGDGSSSAQLREQVLRARAVQRRRFGNPAITNARMTSAQLRKYCRLNGASQQLLKAAISELGLSARAYDKVLRVARTIADIEEAEAIAEHHVAEAIQYRRLDRAEYD